MAQKSKILPGGVKRAIHVFTPALMERLDKTKRSRKPIIAIRSALHNYEMMILCRGVKIHGPSEMFEDFDNPLPGTGGRAVAVMMTEHAVEIFWDETDPDPRPINTKGKKPEDLMAELSRLWR